MKTDREKERLEREKKLFTPEYVQRHVLLEAVNADSNAPLLERCPHVKVLDLAGLYTVPVTMTRKGDEMCLLGNGMLRSLGLTPDQIYEAARKNTVRPLPVRVIRLDRMIDQVEQFGQAYGHALESANMKEQFWYVVCNRLQRESASYILIPEVLETLGEKMGKNFYITVPGANVMMVYPDDRDPELPELLADWFKRSLPDNWNLSNRLYYYHRAKGLSFAEI